MDVQNLQGLVGILITPLTEDGKVDENGLRHLVDFAVDKKLDGLVVLGSNSEFPYLTFEEKLQVMQAAAQAAAGRIPVISTASAWGTDEAVALARESKNAGCSAVLAALPLYFDLKIREVIKHYEAIVSKGGLPVYYYHFPSVTGLHIPPQQLAAIASVDGVVGAKLTVMNKRYLRKAIDATRLHGWKVFTGTSFLMYDCLDYGGAGVFCPLPLIGVDDTRGIYNKFKVGDMTAAKTLQAKVRLAVPLLTGAKANPRLLARGFELMVSLPFQPPFRPAATHGLIKEALRLQGHPLTNRVKDPVAAVGEEQSRLVKRTLQQLSWI